MTLIDELLQQIGKTKEQMLRPDDKVFPRLVGAQIALTVGYGEKIQEWISYLEDPCTAMGGLMRVAFMWEESNEESIAYYMEIVSELKMGLSICLDAVGY